MRLAQREFIRQYYSYLAAAERKYPSKNKGTKPDVTHLETTI